jgi:hypothetical protein
MTRTQMRVLLASLIVVGATASTVPLSATFKWPPPPPPPPKFKEVEPWTSDPSHSNLVTSAWLNGSGCPTGVKIVAYDINPPYDLLPPTPFTAGGCPTGDPIDKRNAGLYLAKSGPSLMNASAGASLTGVKGLAVTELGYDLRKVDYNGPYGSHCGAGAPRFNIVIGTSTYFLGCHSPAATVTASGDGWVRLRWGGSNPLVAYPQLATDPCIPDIATGGCNITGLAVKSIDIVFDEGQDPAFGGPDQFGVAIIDNIDVNGVLVGQDVF